MKLAILPALALALAAPALAQAPAKVDGADLYKFSMVTDPVVSPDGKQVIFTRTYFDIGTDSRQGEIWIGDIGAKDLNRRLLIGAGSRAGGVKWSPDGQRIAYVAPFAGKPQIHVMKLSEGIGRPVTSSKTAPFAVEWAPDGKSLAFAAAVTSDPVKVTGMPAKPEGAVWAADARVTTTYRYRLNETGYLTPGYRHLFVVPAAGGATRQITSGNFDHIDGGGLTWTADGQSLIAVGNRRPERDLQAREADLWLVPINGTTPRQLTDRLGNESEPAVSPDGKWIAFTGFPETPGFYVQDDLWVMPAGGGAAKNLTQGFDRPVANPVWAEDGKGVYVLYNEEGVTRVALVPVNGSAPRTVVKEVGGTRLYLPSAGGNYSAEKGTIAYTSLYTDRPAGLAINRGGKTIATVDFNGDWRKGKSIGKLEEVRYKSSADGRDIQGWVQYPPDFDPAKKYPLILDIHGGPNTDYGPMFSITHQLYAAAGYIVLFTNPRGSIGYGAEFANFYGKPYPSQDHDDLMSGVDLLASRPYVDANNLFIGGGSGGGVLTLWAIAKAPDRFRAAVALRPVTDWTVQALSSDIQSTTAQNWLGAMPWEKPELYRAQSPLSLVGSVKTPTMLITGEADYRTPIAQTEMYYQALKMRGVDAMKVRLPEANHGMGRPSQWLTSILMPIDWFEKYKAK
ncbi:S9 family peptidase [Sphingoaurantiacus capsulatus]|uniref:S9 family peptidase n=1 Tax=Sphingoaurantiacus capsulatus TaxID=1771310 RepID=A0ABV7XDI3_9SPHN